MASGGFGMVDEHLRGKRILVVDDERELADMVAAILHGAGFACVDVVHAGAEALAAIDSRAASPERAYQLLVLDVMMPGMDGFELCRIVRERTDAPIVFLTAKAAEEDAVFGLGVGADDYIRKPFGAAELRAKVGAHLRREKRERVYALAFGDVRLDLAARELYVGEAPVALTKTEFDVCEFLRHPGQVFSRDQIVEGVLGWGAESDAATISVHVSNARAKLKAAGAEPVQTVWGVGYKWIA